jgi:hypothetical protein
MIKEIWLNNIDTAQAIKAQAEQSIIPGHNSHIHIPPNFCAFSSLEQVAALAGQQGCGLLGLSNYYDFHVYETLTSQCLGQGVLPVYGLEIVALDRALAAQSIRVNDPGNPGKIYICGKAITRFESLTPRAQELMGLIRHNDEARVQNMIEKLNAFLKSQGITASLSLEVIRADLSSRYDLPQAWVYLQERHIAQGLYHALESVPGAYAGLCMGWQSDWGPAATQNALRSSLLKAGCPAFAPEDFLTIEQALELIDELGGRRVYPIIGDGIPGISEFERHLPALTQKLAAWGIDTVEFISTRNDVRYLEEAASELISHGFNVTVGTEHNTAEMEPMLPACKGGALIPPALGQAFYHGTLGLLRQQTQGLLAGGGDTLNTWLSCISALER